MRKNKDFFEKFPRLQLIGQLTSRVVMYNTQGEATLLPSLQTQRKRHGCGYYYNNDQVVVS